MSLKIHTLASRNWLMDLIYLAVLFTVFYTLWLGSYPLFTPDEGRYSEVAREMVASGDYITPRVNGVAFLDKPVLYYWLQALAIQLFGIKEWALRLFPALLGIACCLMTYVGGRYLFNRRTGILSAIILATTPLFFGSAHYANLDLEVAALISGALLCFVSAINTPGKPHRGFLLAAYVLAALAFLTKGLIGIAFPAMIGGAWLILTRRLHLLANLHLGYGLVIFFIIVLPWYALAQQANPEFLHFFFVTQQITRFLSAASFNNPAPIWFYLPVILAGFFPWTAFLPLVLAQKGKVELFLYLWLGIVLVFFSIPHSKTVSYILPVFPALALLVGRYLDTAWQHAKREHAYWSMGIFIILSLVFASFLLFCNLIPHLTMLAGVLLGSAICALYLLITRTPVPSFFGVCVVTSIIVLLTIAQGASYLNNNSAKPLVAELKQLLKPQDEVVNYFKFYQDVPVYLEQRITLVADWNSPEVPYRDNWVRELWYGMPFQNTTDWLINEDVFWQRFNSDHRVFVFLNDNYFDKFKANASRYYVLAKHQDIILLSNKPTMLSKYP